MESSPCTVLRGTINHKEENIPYYDLNQEAYSENEKIATVIYNMITDLEGMIYLPNEGDDEMEPYQHAIRGKCMACGSVLGEQTILLADGRGLLGIWDTPECMANIHAVSFLRRVEESLVDAIDAAGPDAASEADAG